MKRYFKKAFFKYALFACTIVSFVFFCGGLRLGTAMMMDHSMQMRDGGAQHLACCQTEAPTARMAHDYLPLSRDMQDILEFAVVALGVASLAYLSFRLVTLDFRECVDRYIRDMRRRFGSPRALHPFTYLFRLGILHPKVW